MRLLRLFLAVVCLAVLAALGFVLSAQAPLIDRIEPPPRQAFDKAAIEKGARLAAIGNCHTCHTAPGGPDYAGNRPIPTPFGTVFSSNITPAPGSGIGGWSPAAFRRALRDGISRRGEHLYPAFPYDHYTRLADDDIAALYAFVMTRPPVETDRKPNGLPFPLDQRWVLSFWNLLFFDDARFQPDPRQSTEWNRGAYLVEGLGHCGDCHTPRNRLGAERRDRALSGGEAEGWTAPALDAASPAPIPWTAAQLFDYLSRGWNAEHGAAAGPMQPVVAELRHADPADLRAIAAYVAALQADAPRPAPPKAPPPAGPSEAAALFAGACARCHVGGAAMAPPRGIDLAHSTAVNEADPRNAIRVVLDGVSPGAEEAGPFMPPFRGAFDDRRLTALLAYVRAHFSSRPAWSDLDAKIHRLRRGTR